jgi:hypothetical protein
MLPLPLLLIRGGESFAGCGGIDGFEAAVGKRKSVAKRLPDLGTKEGPEVTSELSRKHFQERSAELQIPRLRFGMTKRRGWL